MKKYLDRLLSSLKKEDGGKPNKLGYVMVIALFGLLLLIVSNLFQQDTQNTNEIPEISDPPNQTDSETLLQKDDSSKSSIVSELEGGYEKDLEELLNKIQGISDAEVMVNLDSTKKKVFETNLVIGTQTTEEVDQNGGERNIEDQTREEQTVIVRQGDKEVPLLVQTKKPDVRGVLVVAKGVENIELKKWVVEAVSRVLDAPSHIISVMPKN
ncbi:stage III sporulation protein AG [Radiobacillus kanasensis]|uniref:stage III sporulation protein AG n=1 Tax=Radiobacillus kanasensis TaxID=2844358 RepID=UPI001E4803CE|nr:stage III sporulation protein AG [Radiobacillus kanasensis]UFT97736.1 stage III sporulation protein AG [Radiobacillus kanasensis]